MSSDERGLLDKRLIPLQDDEYAGPDMLFQSFAPRRLFRHASWYGLVSPYLRRFETVHEERMPFHLARANRVTALRPTEEHFPGFVHYRTDYSKRLILNGFQNSPGGARGGACVDMSRCVRITDWPDYRGYEVKSAGRPALDRMAFDDEAFVVVPDTTTTSTADTPGWTVSSQRRLERLVDLERGDVPPYHCVRPELYPLRTQIGERDFVWLRIRMADGTYDEDDSPPTGALAHAISVDFVPDEVEAGEGGSEPVRPVEARDVAVDLRYVALFPEATRESAEAVRAYVKQVYTSDGLAFDDATIEYGNALVRVRERRPLPALLES